MRAAPHLIADGSHVRSGWLPSQRGQSAGIEKASWRSVAVCHCFLGRGRQPVSLSVSPAALRSRHNHRNNQWNDRRFQRCGGARAHRLPQQQRPGNETPGYFGSERELFVLRGADWPIHPQYLCGGICQYDRECCPGECRRDVECQRHQAGVADGYRTGRSERCGIGSAANNRFPGHHHL